jgi:hypothetical protein
MVSGSPLRCGTASQEHVLEAEVEAFHHPFRLRMVCCRLGMLDVKQVAQGGPQGGGELGSAVLCVECWGRKSAHPFLKQSICAVDCSGGGDVYRFRPAGNSVHDSEGRGPCL